MSLCLPNLIFTDTYSHALYFSNIFHINISKFQRIFVGGDDLVFKPIKKQHKNNLIVEFHGMFTRLSGAEYFIKAAKIMEKDKHIKFWLIGDSKVYKLPLKILSDLKPNNLQYFTPLKYIDLAKKISQADISVGHLGNSAKAKRVITNKSFHGLACRNINLVTDIPANRELFNDKITAVFIKPANPEDLASKIKLLSKNTRLRNEIAKNGLYLYKEKLTNQKIGLLIKNIFINTLINI